MKTEYTKRDQKAWQQMQLERMLFQMQQAKPATTATTATKKTGLYIAGTANNPRSAVDDSHLYTLSSWTIDRDSLA